MMMFMFLSMCMGVFASFQKRKWNRFVEKVYIAT